MRLSKASRQLLLRRAMLQTSQPAIDIRGLKLRTRVLEELADKKITRPSRKRRYLMLTADGQAEVKKLRIKVLGLLPESERRRTARR